MTGNSDSVKIIADLEYGEKKEIQVDAKKFVRTVMEASRKESVDTISLDTLVDGLDLGLLVTDQYNICMRENGTSYFRRKVPWAREGFKIVDGELLVPDGVDPEDVPNKIVENWKRMAEAASNASERYDGEGYSSYLEDLLEELER